jgi:predicted DNA-binding helix-hairpin-helix protein
VTGAKTERPGRKKRKEGEGKCHLEIGMLHTASVDGTCHEFIKIYYSRTCV